MRHFMRFFIWLFGVGAVFLFLVSFQLISL